MFVSYSDIEKVKLLPYKAFKLKIINEIKMDKVELSLTASLYAKQYSLERYAKNPNKNINPLLRSRL